MRLSYDPLCGSGLLQLQCERSFRLGPPASVIVPLLLGWAQRICHHSRFQRDQRGSDGSFLPV
jgi:hypothetical protein